MFSKLTQLVYRGKRGNEHTWGVENDPTNNQLAGTLLGNNVVRVRFLRGENFDEARYQLADGGEGTLPYHSWIVAKGDEEWMLPDDTNDPPAILESYLDAFAYSTSELRFEYTLAPDERIYGFGERTDTMNKRGRAFPVWNIDFPGRHDETVTSMYASIPFFTGLQATSGQARGVLIDHTGKIDVDMGQSDDQLATLTVEGDSLVVYFFTGPTPADVLHQYSELTGHMPLPARWSLGHHQCRWSYMSEQVIEDLATRIRERNHPCDAIWLDIDYMDGYKNFTFHPERYPDPARLTEGLHAQGFHLVTILDPGTKVDEEYDVYREGVERDYFCQYPDGKNFIGSVWPGLSVFPDFSRSEVRTWWGNLYQRLLDKGVDGIWNDMNEPALTNSLLEKRNEDEPDLWGKTMDSTVQHRAGGDLPTGPDGPPVKHRFFHNAYGMEMARSTYEGQLRLRPNSRPFVLTRSGTAGMQRYTALWTGDNTSEWSHIRLAIRMCLSIGISGVPFVGADIGGFWDACNGELLTRFVQLGALMPFSRNHNAIGNPDQEPWAFGEPYESAYRTAIETRYRLLPHLYTLFHQASQDGTPVMRPLYYHYPQDVQACDNETEFLIGDSLLSAPISEPGVTRQSVYLPAGTWYDFWDSTVYQGGTTHEIAAPLERWPMCIRANSIIPTGPVLQYTDQKSTDPLTFSCYMENNGEAHYVLYEDDGSTQDYRKGAYATTSVTCRVESEKIILQIEERHEGFTPKHEFYDVIVYVDGLTLEQRVRAGQGTITFQI